MKWLLRRAARSRPCTPADMPGRPPVVRLEGAAKEAIEIGRNRLVVAIMLFGLVFAVLAGRLVHLTLTNGGAEPTLARGGGMSLDPERGFIAERRSIVDRNGLMLATNLRAASLYADARKIPEPARVAARLVEVLPDLARADVLTKLTSGKSFVWLKRNLTPRQQDAVNRLGVPGLQFQVEQRRVYPQGALVAHAVGFTDIDGRGIAGIEQFFDEILRDPRHGDRPLMLSLDLRVQHVLRDELQLAVHLFNAVGAGGLVLDVHTGEVLAMVSLPDFDPAAPSEGAKDARFNRTTLGVYEMGSTMKALTTAMALDLGTTQITGGYDASRPIEIARFTIRDNKPKNRWLSVPEIFKYSSNIGSAKMALDVGPTRQREFLGNFGMLRKPTIELPEVGQPLVPRRWKAIETMTIGFGHGLSVSPLQLGSAYAAIVNGGKLRQASLVRRDDNEPVPAVTVILPATSGIMRKLLHLVVDEGTGRKAGVDGYLVGGKTGTSEKVGERGGYNRKALLNTFVAVFPMNAPRYVLVGLLDEPKAIKETHGYATAGWTTAPMIGRVIARVAPILGVPPVDEQSDEIRNAMAIGVPSQAERKLAAY